MLFSTDIPSAPGKVVPTRNTDTSVVVSWEASSDAKDLVGYYIEASVVGSDVWEPCNNKPVKATRWDHFFFSFYLIRIQTSLLYKCGLNDFQVYLPWADHRWAVCVQGEGSERSRTQPVLPDIRACGGESCNWWVKRIKKLDGCFYSELYFRGIL